MYFKKKTDLIKFLKKSLFGLSKINLIKLLFFCDLNSQIFFFFSEYFFNFINKLSNPKENFLWKYTVSFMVVQEELLHSRFLGIFIYCVFLKYSSFLTKFSLNRNDFRILKNKTLCKKAQKNFHDRHLYRFLNSKNLNKKMDYKRKYKIFFQNFLKENFNFDLFSFLNISNDEFFLLINNLEKKKFEKI